jgi:hypothetical protein
MMCAVIITSYSFARFQVTACKGRRKKDGAAGRSAHGIARKSLLSAEQTHTMPSNDLMRAIATGEHPSRGCIRIWNDETGKPGEMEYHIDSVSYDDAEKKLTLDLSQNEKVVAYGAGDIVINASKFSVKSAQKVSWFQSGIEILSYTNNGKNIVGRSAIPFKHFNTQTSANALEVYGKK